MRMVFFLVALANVALFMWEYNKGAFERVIESSETATYSGQERILLVSELSKVQPGDSTAERHREFEDERQTDSGMGNKNTANKHTDEFTWDEIKIDAAEPPVKQDIINCYEAGPFIDEAIYEVWERQLSSSGAEIRAFSRADKTVEDYVVFYPSGETMEQSEINLKMLKSQGLKEFWMVENGGEKGQILLGIFSREVKALKMKAQLQAKGIDAEIRARYKNKSNKVQKYALIKGGGKLMADLDLLKKNDPSISVESIPGTAGSCMGLDESGQGSSSLISHDRVKSSEKSAAYEKSNGATDRLFTPGVPDTDIALEKLNLGQKSVDKEIANAVQASRKEQNRETAQKNPNVMLEKSVSEQKDSNQDISVSNNARVINNKESQSCYEAGPFANERQAWDWKEQLTNVEADVTFLTREGKSIGDYLVYYPAAATAEQSEANLKMLKSQGLTDVWMIRKGEGKGQISLGVFKNEERALVLKERMQTKGIIADVKPRYKNKLQKYAFVKGGGKVSENLKALEKNYPGIMLVPVNNCSEHLPEN